MTKFAAIALVILSAGCSGCPSRKRPERLDVSAASMGLYAAPIIDMDGKVSLAIRILNHPRSGVTVWVNHSIGRVGNAFGVVTASLYDEHAKEVSDYCTDDASSPPHPLYKALAPGEWVESVIRPWCTALDLSRVYLVQVQWDDSYPTIPIAPKGVQTFRGPLVSPIIRIEPSKLSTEPNWQAITGY